MYIPFWCYLQFIIWSSNKRRISLCMTFLWLWFHTECDTVYSLIYTTAFGPPWESVSIFFVEFLLSGSLPWGERDGCGSIMWSPAARCGVFWHCTCPAIICISSSATWTLYESDGIAYIQKIDSRVVGSWSNHVRSCLQCMICNT